MRFSTYFDDNFFETNQIKLDHVNANKEKKSFTVFLTIDTLLDIINYKKLLKGLAKLQKENRLYSFDYEIKTLHPRYEDKSLYLLYFQTILTETGIDYDLLNLANSNVNFENGNYEVVIAGERPFDESIFLKAQKRFLKHGLAVSFSLKRLDKEQVLELKNEKIEKEKQEIIQNISIQKEELERKEEIDNINKKPKKFIKTVETPVEPIKNIPATQSGIDECINTTGSTEFTIAGTIFNVEHRTLPKCELYEISITDKTDSIMVKKFIRTENDKELFAKLKCNDVIKVSGKASYDTYAREVTLMANKITYIGEEKKEERKDLATEKRVELHLHTNMSALDALTPAEEYIEQALKWGHKAIAFTDHDGVYSFHDVMKATKGKPIKPIYGCELGYVDEAKFNIAYTEDDIDLKDATYVVFDIETTGFSVHYDQIIQIGARKVLHGQVISTFEEFINPKRHIPAKITDLTSITDEMVKDAKTIDDVLPRFIDFIGDSILVAQNASFDVGHIYENMRKLGITREKPFPVIDTMQLARNFFANELKTFNLKSLSRFFKVQQEHHHLADDDTRVTTEIFLQMLQTLYKHNIYNYKDINKAIDPKEAYKHIVPSHITLLVTNQVGYKNLFKIISDAMTEHFYGGSRVLKSVLESLREGVLVGSACSNGEIFETALNKSDDDLRRLIPFYDYIEVQPPKVYADAIHKDPFDDVNYVEICEDTIKRIIRISKELGKIVVATGDVHYLNKEQKEFRDIYISAPQIGGGIHSLLKCKQTPLVHFRTTDEMLKEFSFLGVDLAHEIVVTNTNKIADLIGDVVAFRDGKNDLYSPADDEFKDSLKVPSIKDDLVRLVYEKAYHDYGNPLPAFVQARLDKELNSIINNGYSPVYYMAYLLVHKSNSDGYVVGSRGSVGSSFVATMMKITEVNPLPPHYFCPKCHFSVFKFTDEEKAKYPITKEQLAFDEVLQKTSSGYDLPRALCPCCKAPLSKDGQDIPFETFLGFTGDKTPDIDLNFSGEYQGRAHEYIRTLMGSEHAFRAGTVTTVAEKVAIGYVRGHLERTGVVKRNVEVARIAKQIEGVRRSTGQHPGGIVVVPSYKDIYDVTPIQYPADKTDNNWRTTHFEYHNFEANLLKLDILGHDDPTTLRYLFDYVEAHPDEFPFHTPQEIPLDDPLVYRMFYDVSVLGLTEADLGCSVATYAIPEFGTKFTRQMLIDTKPKNFSDLVKISGLSHGTNVWNTNSQELVLGRTEFGTIPFAEVIGCRDDIMVYLLEHGLAPKMAFDIMEFVRKGKAAKKSDPVKWQGFVDEMKEKKIPDWYYWSCERIEYMFPKAHAVAYVLSALRIAWFKIHKPILFYSAFFTIRASQFEPSIMLSGVDKIKSRMNEIENMPKTTVKDDDLLTMYQVAYEMLKRGMNFLQVDIMKSHATEFLIEGNALRLPFISVPGLGESVALDIMEKRNEKAFTSKSDVSKRTKLNKTLFEKMEQLGSFGDLAAEDEAESIGLFAFNE